MSPVTAHYEVKFNPVPPPTPPQTFAYAGGLPDSNIKKSWGAEIVFKSRFYEILVLGKGWPIKLGTHPERGHTAGRLLWAIYDSQDKKVIWRRWLFPADR